MDRDLGDDLDHDGFDEMSHHSPSSDQIRSFTELFHWCEAKINATDFFTPCEVLFERLKDIGVADAEHQFATSIGETAESWEEAAAFPDWQVLDWCKCFCADKIFESKEVPLHWNSAMLGFPPKPVDTINGLIEAFDDAFKFLQRRGSDWNNLTQPETDWARSLLDSIQQQALLLDIDAPETHHAENMELVQQLLEIRKILLRARRKPPVVGNQDEGAASRAEDRLADHEADTSNPLTGSTTDAMGVRKTEKMQESAGVSKGWGASADNNSLGQTTGESALQDTAGSPLVSPVFEVTDAEFLEQIRKVHETKLAADAERGAKQQKTIDRIKRLRDAQDSVRIATQAERADSASIQALANAVLGLARVVTEDGWNEESEDSPQFRPGIKQTTVKWMQEGRHGHAPTPSEAITLRVIQAAIDGSLDRVTQLIEMALALAPDVAYQFVTYLSDGFALHLAMMSDVCTFDTSKRRSDQIGYDQLQQLLRMDDSDDENDDADGKRKIPARHDTAHSPDFTSVHWYGNDHVFTANQALCVEILWRAMESRTPVVTGAEILDRAGVNQERLDKVFTITRGGKQVKHLAWGTMIVAADGAKGRYRLNVPQNDPEMSG